MRNGANIDTGAVSDVPNVGVALINWNSGDLTAQCLTSLIAGTMPPSHIVVVDNASTDGSLDRLRREFLGVEFIENAKNEGFTGATNTAVARLLDSSAEFVWILNNDTVVDRRCLELLLQCLRADESISAISGGILLFDSPDRIWYMGSWMQKWTMRVPHHRQGEFSAHAETGPIVVDFISGCCMLIRRSALESVGLLDDRFFAYAEDYDWCLRATAIGEKLCCLPEAKLWHRGSASVKRNTLGKSRGHTSARLHYLVTRNMLYILRKHAPSRTRLVIGATAHLVPRLLVAVATAALGRLEKASAILRGARDGFVTPL